MTQIEILGRIKPNLKNNKTLCVNTNDNNITIKREQKSIIDNYSVSHKYNFDKVFDDKCDNLDIYNHLSINILHSIIKENQNVTFYLYGQTGSGKTHTLLGSNKEDGFLGLILNDIIHINYPIKASAVEIYNNKCMDILNKKNAVCQRENNNQFVISYIKKKDIQTPQHVIELKQIISKYRSTGTSSENDTSSRSHLKITIEFNNQILNLIDLAGCEKARMTKNIGKNMYRENAIINQSLFALKECIRALCSNKKHVPFRRSELTKMLRHSFEQNTKTYIMATIPQEQYNSNTTIDVLNYISSVKKIKVLETNRVMSSHLRRERRKAASPVQLANQFIDVLGSPRYQSIYANKRVLDHLNVIENDIINKIIDTKSSKYLIDDYHEILNKKKKILQRNNTENSNPPSPENPKKSFKTPKSKFIKTKND
tara:strand:+ start:3549 stop:4829 length:1281 start_codon:yes stop_codon:yes gene_type:complete